MYIRRDHKRNKRNKICSLVTQVKGKLQPSVHFLSWVDLVELLFDDYCLTSLLPRRGHSHKALYTVINTSMKGIGKFEDAMMLKLKFRSMCIIYMHSFRVPGFPAALHRPGRGEVMGHIYVRPVSWSDI